MNIPAYPVKSAVPLEGRDYLPYVLDRIGRAQTRIWASVFIIDARIHKDVNRSVRSLIEELNYARWRNVDVRIIVGTSDIEDIYTACVGSSFYMKKRGLNIRSFDSPYRSSSHSKYLIFDNDVVITGSNNWTNNALHRSVETSLAVESEDLNKNLAREFSSVWKTSGEVQYGS